MTWAMMQDWLHQGQLTIPNVLLKYYRQIGLNERELVVLLQLQAANQQEGFPNFQTIAQQMNCSRDELFEAIQSLINKQVLTIHTIQNSAGKSEDRLNFDVLYEKLWHCLQQQQKQAAEKEETLKLQDLYTLFEQEFGRSLSPIELDTLNMWLDDDHYAPELIQMALKEAVLNQVYSLKYIDRILLSWEKKNITTKAQVLEESKKFRQTKSDQLDRSQVQRKKPMKDVPLHDWLRDVRPGERGE
ncbi:hypothetical protein B8A44_06550 [Dolosigranulum pigrum]|uniref:Uncharacterized protein n=1 Tax=Dolosigranulum pigrum TaxID=29394 RepID=A0A328KMH8_9LACT|nr:DnaD domain-containing protein [Dolosigranulum pigrum]QTJ43031.1 DnaD domain-containing protein [Dolosigranulum pigrum]QTJ46434.1 DnaD domain-containing protein [Dolosigranulum pigrum]QTJ51552.1 DnaD domain-containing protein [Dolosigranulum pigrum]RAN51293.1 hypothetical protein B8A39_07295 [Dolosigranulum pigrum]RAN62904.1 hypothetical protein B8A44_06550 [Dolosigranulum pigrum]